MAQPKQLKKLILTDNRNIFTNRFQTIQRLQANFMNDSIRISYIPSNQTYKHSPNNQNNDINLGFTTN